MEFHFLGYSDRLWDLVGSNEKQWETMLQASLSILCLLLAHSQNHFEELDTILLIALNLGG